MSFISKTSGGFAPRKETQFPFTDPLWQSVDSRIGGYQDVKHAERLTQHPMIWQISFEKVWERAAAPTARLQSCETALLTQEDNLAGLAAINRALIALRRHSTSPHAS